MLLSFLEYFSLAALAAICIWYAITKLAGRFDKRRLPPGPRPKPFIGNIFDFPKEEPWLKFADWAKEYGDLVHLEVLGEHFLFLNTKEVAVDLLEKRSSIYSDRKTTTMLTELVGLDWSFAFQPYGENWRAGRRMFQAKFGSKAVGDHRETVVTHINYLLQNLASTPNKFFSHLRHYSGGAIMDVAYGIKIRQTDDPLLAVGEQALDAILTCAVPGAYLVDILPLLKYWPSFLWGGDFQKKAIHWRKKINDVLELPYEMAIKSSYSDGSQSFVSYWLSKISDSSNSTDHDTLMKLLPGSASTAFLGGYETTASVLEVFFLAMLLKPEVQAKAQEELDTVIGRDRLPQFPDQEQLPYIRAICNEVLRWRPVAPLNVPHRLTEDDKYRGMFIPKGTIVISNTWTIFRNKEEFGPEDVDDFIPERFMREDVKVPDAGFGFGRRMCPGRFSAMETLYIAVASILQLYSIKPKGGSSAPKLEQFKWISTLTVHPEPFECSITPRFESVFDLISSNN